MNKNYKLFKTLQFLSENSRITSKKLAKEINTTQQNANYIIQNLNKENIIKSQLLLIDSSKFNFNNYIIFLRLNQHSKSFLNQFTAELKKYKEITVIEILFGNYDLLIRFTTENTSQFNKILKEIVYENNNSIINYLILTQIVEYFFPKNYLSKKKIISQKILSGDREFIKIDNFDKKIINILNNNSKTNFSKIANELNSTSKTIIDRVKKLENRKIIRGYSININYHKINLQKKYLNIKTNLQNIILEKNFIKYCQNNPNITNIIKVFGNWDIIITIETITEDTFKEILFEIKDKYYNFIADYEFIESIETKKYKYIPELE